MGRAFRLWLALGGTSLLLLLAAAAWVWRDDIARTALDPREPYQTYQPPRAPNYDRRAAWALWPKEGETAPADVFFIHPTTYNGGEEWNARIAHRGSDEVLFRTMLPNYAGPYQRIARVFAPRYRQASLYTMLTLRDDAREARAFAYRDVRDAFRHYLRRQNRGRPFLVVGVEQGGLLASRLIAEEILPNPNLRFAGAHLAETAVPVGALPACSAAGEPGCVMAWLSVAEGEDARARRVVERALVWRGDRLVDLQGRPPLCVNPILGRRTAEAAPPALHHGAVNASGLEWGLRPAVLKRQVAARCVDSVLRVSRPESPSLRPSGGWAERRRAAPYNLFYADLEADAQARLAALGRSQSGGVPAAPAAAAPLRP
jgi:hypothetical protein